MVGRVDTRRTGRVLLLDPHGCVLLFHVDGPDAFDTIWLTPGGALQVAEEPAAAALRELREETGLRVDSDRLGGPVATTERRSPDPHRYA